MELYDRADLIRIAEAGQNWTPTQTPLSWAKDIQDQALEVAAQTLESWHLFDANRDRDEIVGQIRALKNTQEPTVDEQRQAAIRYVKDTIAGFTHGGPLAEIDEYRIAEFQAALDAYNATLKCRTIEGWHHFQTHCPSEPQATEDEGQWQAISTIVGVLDVLHDRLDAARKAGHLAGHPSSAPFDWALQEYRRQLRPGPPDA